MSFFFDKINPETDFGNVLVLEKGFLTIDISVFKSGQV